MFFSHVLYLYTHSFLAYEAPNNSEFTCISVFFLFSITAPIFAWAVNFNGSNFMFHFRLRTQVQIERDKEQAVEQLQKEQ